MCFLIQLVKKKKIKQINHQHLFLEIFLSKAKNKIIKNNPKTTN